MKVHTTCAANLSSRFYIYKKVTNKSQIEGVVVGAGVGEGGREE